MDGIKCSSNKAKTFKKNLGWLYKGVHLNVEEQRAGYGGLGRADVARNDVLQKFQLASIGICHSEGTVNSQERI